MTNGRPYADLAQLVDKLKGKDREICERLLELQDARPVANEFGVATTSIRMKAYNWRKKFFGKPESAKGEPGTPEAALRRLGVSPRKLWKMILDVAQSSKSATAKLNAIRELLSIMGQGNSPRSRPVPQIVVRVAAVEPQDLDALTSGGKFETQTGQKDEETQ